jgi:outer membrane protein OmpA-like peptidoglycan-associated protein
MRVSKYLPIFASLLLAVAAQSPALAQSDTMPSVQIESTSIMLGIGGQSGDGILNLPNLGTNCTYPFSVSGFGAGIQVSVSKVAAAGPVKNLTRLEDFPGQYSVFQGETTLIAGAGATSMKNAANVEMDLASRTQGLGIGFGAQGLTVKMNVPPPTAPRVYVMEFGFNKDWVGEDARAKLAQVVAVWKCRFVSFDLLGATDTVGKEDKNLDLSSKRAAAVRDYLVGAGVVPTRITAHAAGEGALQVPTGQGVRMRSNRVVILTVR